MRGWRFIRWFGFTGAVYGHGNARRLVSTITGKTIVKYRV